MKRVSTILVMILFVMAGCSGDKRSGEPNDGLITVDVAADHPKKELILQDFMDVEYIPLETNDEFVTMAWVHAIGKKVIVVRDRSRTSNGTIYIFDRKGKGVRTFNRMGGSAEEYAYPLGITLDEDNDELFVNDRAGKILVYDLSGNYKRTLNLQEDKRYGMDIYNFDRNNLICRDDAWGEDGMGNPNSFLIISKQDGSITKEIEIPYKEKVSSMVFTADRMGVMPIRNRTLVPQGSDRWSLMENSSDTIYLYKSDHTMTPVIVRTPPIGSMSPGVFLYPAVLTDRYYFMQTVKAEWNWERNTGHQRINLIFDKQDNTLSEYVMYNADMDNNEPVIMTSEVTYGDNEIACVHKLEAEDILEAYEKGQLKGQLKEVAAGLEEDSNPVLMLVKYKK